MSNTWKPQQKPATPTPADNLAINAGRNDRRLQEENDRLRAELAAARGEDGEETSPELETRRRDRQPFGGMAQKLFWPKRPGYHRHWFNDEPGRVDRAKSAGYEHVLDDTKKPVSRVVGKFPNGSGKMAYLMEIPQSWFNEDMMLNQQIVDRTCEDIYRGTVGRNISDGGYIKKLPSGSLDMSR